MVKVRHYSLDEAANPARLPRLSGVQSPHTGISNSTSPGNQTPNIYKRRCPPVINSPERDHLLLLQNQFPASRRFTISNATERKVSISRDPDSFWGSTLIDTVTPEGVPMEFQRTSEEVSEDEDNRKTKILRHRLRHRLRRRTSSAHDDDDDFGVEDIKSFRQSANTFTGASMDSRRLQEGLQTKLKGNRVSTMRSIHSLRRHRKGSVTIQLDSDEMKEDSTKFLGVNQSKTHYRKYSVGYERQAGIGDFTLAAGVARMTTNHTGLLLSLPLQNRDKVVHFSVGVGLAVGEPKENIGWFKRHILKRHSIGSNHNPNISAIEAEKSGIVDYPLRRSISMTSGVESKRQSNDIFIGSITEGLLKSYSLSPNISSPIEATPIKRARLTVKSLRRVKKVMLGLNLKAIHWPLRKHSHLPPPYPMRKNDTLNQPLDEMSALNVNHPLKIHIDDVTPLRSIAPPNPDPKSGHIGRFVVLKATVSPTSGVDSSSTNNQPISNIANPQWSITLDDSNCNPESEGVSGSNQWSVTNSRTANSVLLTAPGARTTRQGDHGQYLDISGGRTSGRDSSTGGQTSRHTRFRKFLVESFGSSRTRTHSEQQSHHTADFGSTAYDTATNSKSRHGVGILPPHAHTITSGTNRSVLKDLLQPARAKDDGALGVSSDLSSSSNRRLNNFPSSSVSSVNDGSSPYPENAATLPADFKRKLKTPRKVIRQLLRGGNNQKNANDNNLPDPSKLPREEPQSSLEFTQSRLKNLPRKNTGFEVGRKGKNYSPNVSSSILPRNFLLQHGTAKSEELLLNAFSPPNGCQVHHHHHHHNHRCHGSSSHYRRCHTGSSSHRHQSTLTRVTENRRYLMFTKESPFRSPRDFLNTRGKGLNESETYSVLFQHTTCYELMPESAKLVTLDSQLPVGKAFRALCLNGIRAAPVWDSKTQQFSSILTINDFLQMLTYCWRPVLSGALCLTVDDLESLPIRRWKEICENLTSHRRESTENKQVTVESTAGNDQFPARRRRGFSSDEAEIDSAKVAELNQHSLSAGSISQEQTNQQPTPISCEVHNHCRSTSQSSNTSVVSAPSQLGGQLPALSSCLRRLSSHKMGGLTIIQPDDTLYDALMLLARTKQHRLPVFDDPYVGTGNPLFVLTHRSLLAYLYKKQGDLPRPTYLQSPLKEVGVGTYENLAMVTPSTKLIDALTFFEGERVSALPVVDSLAHRHLQDIFAKFDVITLILAGKHKKPDMTVQDALDICKNIHRGVIPAMTPTPDGPNKFDVEICLTTDTIQYAINKLMRTGYHRLIIVNNNEKCRVEGVVSMSDLLYYMVLRSNAPQIVFSSLKAELVEAPDWLFLPENEALNSIKVPLLSESTNISASNQKSNSDIPEVKTLTQLVEEEGGKRPRCRGAFRNRRFNSSSSSNSSGSSISSRSCTSSSSDTCSSSSENDDNDNASTHSESESGSPSPVESPSLRRRQQRLTNPPTLSP